MPLWCFFGRLSSHRSIWVGFCLLTLLAIGFTALDQFSRHDHQLPRGCDEFGYLNMAKAISEGTTFTDHTQRPFIKDLLADLKRTFPNADDYRWMVAPHAYHVSPKLDKIINQYPPGVGLMLALVPLEYRRLAYPVVSVLIGFLILLLAGCLDTGRCNYLTVALLPLIAVILFFIQPMRGELQRVGSLAPTFGFLIGAGWLLPRKPFWSLALLSASTIFRIPNALLIAPVGLAALFLSDPKINSFIGLIRRFFGLGLSTLIGGLGVYILYAWLLLGNPFAITYSRLDKEFATFSSLTGNLHFYLITNREWFLPHVGILSVLLLVCFIRGKYVWFFFAVILCLFNYTFYIFHKVQIGYYPYASALFALGLTLGVAEMGRLNTRVRAATIILGCAACVVMAAASRLPEATTVQQYAIKALPYQNAFSDKQVVWAEHCSGTIEYTTNRAGFRYNWGTNSARKYVLLWLLSHGYSQVIWVDDEGMKPSAEIEKMLDASAIKYTKKTASDLGVYLEVLPQIPETLRPAQ